MKYVPIISRSLIAVLFVVAGYQKLTNFAATTNYIGSLGIPMAGLVTALVIFIEIVVALSFAYGYMVCTASWILIAFTALTILLIHNNFAVGDNMVMALKNVAIIGGLLAASQMCDCGKCLPSKGKHGAHAEHSA